MSRPATDSGKKKTRRDDISTSTFYDILNVSPEISSTPNELVRSLLTNKETIQYLYSDNFCQTMLQYYFPMFYKEITANNNYLLNRTYRFMQRKHFFNRPYSKYYLAMIFYHQYYIDFGVDFNGRLIKKNDNYTVINRKDILSLSLKKERGNGSGLFEGVSKLYLRRNFFITSIYYEPRHSVIHSIYHLPTNKKVFTREYSWFSFASHAFFLVSETFIVQYELSQTEHVKVTNIYKTQNGEEIIIDLSINIEGKHLYVFHDHDEGFYFCERGNKVFHLKKQTGKLEDETEKFHTISSVLPIVILPNDKKHEMSFDNYDLDPRLTLAFAPETYENNIVNRGTDEMLFYEPVRARNFLNYLKDYREKYLVFSRWGDVVEMRDHGFYTVKVTNSDIVTVSERYFEKDMKKMDVGNRIGLCDGCMNLSTHRCACGDALYCSKACQSEHWSVHSIDCKI